MGWLTGWAYREEVTLVEQSSGAYNDLPTIITAAYNAHMKSDFADCRFTESDGTTLIAYGIKEKTDDIECQFVIKRSYTSGASLTVYLYYSNADAADASVDYTSWCQDWYINNGFGKSSSAHQGSPSCAIYNHSETDDIPSWSEHVFGGCTARGSYRAYYGHVKINGTGAKWASDAKCLGKANALKLRWDKYNCSDSMYDHASFVKGASNTVQWDHYQGNNPGFWVSWYPAEPSVSFGGEQTPIDEVNLFAQFEAGQGSEDLPCGFFVNQWQADLPAAFFVNQWQEDLFGEFFVLNVGSAELAAAFDGQAVFNLPAEFEVGQDSVDLPAEFYIPHKALVNLFGEFIIRHEISVDLKAQVNIVHWTSLPASFQVGQGSEALEGEFVVRHDQFGQLLAAFEVDHFINLPAGFVVRHTVPDPLKFKVFGPYLARDAVNEDDGITYPFQRKIWHAAGRRWIFYVWSYNFRYISSLDGVSWTAPTTIRAVNFKEYGRQISTWVEADGSLHYVYGPQSSGGEPRYRKGQLESDGTITWAAAEQVLSSIPGGSYCDWPSICVDVNGYPWIGFYYFDPSPDTRRAYIITSTTKDGIWTTNPNYGSRGLQLNTASLISWAVIPVPLANGKVAAYYGGGNGTKFWVRICDGDGIGDEAEASSGGDWDNYYTGAAIALKDVVIAGFGSTDLTIRLCRWENEAWASEITIQTGVQANTCPAFSRIGDTIFITWIDTVADEIRYKLSRDEGATWEPSGDTSHSVLLADPSGMGGRTRYSMGYEARSTLGFSYVRAGDLIMYGWLEPETAPELFAQFDVGQDSVDLPARFEVGQGSIELLGEFEAQAIAELLGKFEAQATAELFSKFDVGQGSAELPAWFLIPRAYDFSSGMGISFDWWGSGGVDQHIDFEMWSLTGGWVGRFPDGAAEWRHVQISWDDLTPVDLDGTEPDSSQIIGIYWTYHTPGIRRIDGIRAWMRQDLLCKVVIRNVSDLDLLGKLRARAQVSLNLPAEFKVPQGFNDLAASFELAERVIDVYQNTGTGTIDAPIVFTVMEGMTQTINGMLVGDKVIINFDCTIKSKSGSGHSEVHFKMRVDGAGSGQLGPENDVQFTAVSEDALKTKNVAMTRMYEVLAPGDYTFTVQWDQDGVSAGNDCPGGRRTMVITHIR